MNTTTTTIDIPVDKLHISEHNTRQPGDTDPGVKELAKSLGTAGQTAAILVRPHPEKKGHYEIAAGARRSVAARIAGLKTLRASVVEMDDNRFQTSILVDNLQRENPDPRAEAELLLKLHERGNTAVEIGAHMGKPESWVTRRMKLLSVDAKILKEWRNPDSDFHHFTIDMMELLGSLRVSDQRDIVGRSLWVVKQIKNRSGLLEEIRRNSPSLKDAPFDLNDPRFFVKDCGPGCATDSSKQGTIFDFKIGKKKDECSRCLNGVCFKQRMALYINAEYDRLCEKAGSSLPVITETQVTIKGHTYHRDYNYNEWAKTGKAVAHVDDDGKISLKYLKEKEKAKGKDDKDQETPEAKMTRKINTLQGKRWLHVREKLVEKLEKATLTTLTCDIDRVVATFGLPFKITGSVAKPNESKRWQQVFEIKDPPLKCVADGYCYSDSDGDSYIDEGGSSKKSPFTRAKAAPRKEALWPHVKEVLLGLIPEPKRLMDAYLYENDYRYMANLIGFNIEAAKKAADLEILPPKSFGNVDPHTLK
jgi:ParB/RepB/Spo0J family partition protein